MNHKKKHNIPRSLIGLPLYPVEPDDEYLHPIAVDAHYTSTETSYFGFSIPEKKINGEIYIWFHPALNVMSGGVYVWKGKKTTSLSCEYVNHYHYLPFPKGDIDDYRIEPLGLHVTVIKPLEEIQVEIEDNTRGFKLNLNNSALIEPVGRPRGKHFVQPMKTSGELVLEGDTFSIDGYFTRDRSWSGYRSEACQVYPPLSWMSGIVNKKFAFHLVAFDDPDMEPEWLNAYPQMQEEQNLIWGFVYRDGEAKPLKAARKLTHRNADGLSPKSFDMVLVEDGDQEYKLNGSVAAIMPWQTWQNINVYFCQVRWRIDGMSAWGDTHEMQYHDFIHRFHNDLTTIK